MAFFLSFLLTFTSEPCPSSPPSDTPCPTCEVHAHNLDHLSALSVGVLQIPHCRSSPIFERFSSWLSVTQTSTLVASPRSQCPSSLSSDLAVLILRQPFPPMAVCILLFEITHNATSPKSYFNSLKYHCAPSTASNHRTRWVPLCQNSV